ncbi:hypothetical protein [Deinococcus multiflagellatus]|uniref:Uncharacterized protein n=1 Tax=Deinococcus multiflagellatus TaxID=1656887 RepID=A0ABW1ZIG8_9DEIO
MADVQFSLVAPFRSARPERLTTVQVYQGEPPVMLAVLNSETSSAWLIEPVGNMNICIWKQGYTLRDLDQNSLREFALLTSCGDGPGGAFTLNLFAWLGGELRPWGDLSAYEVGPEDAANTRQRELRRTLYVQKGQVPQFAAVTREQRWTWDNAGHSQILSTRTYVEPLRLQDSSYRVRRLW